MRAKWYVIAWRLLWAIPAYTTRVLFVAAIFCGWGWQAARDAWWRTE